MPRKLHREKKSWRASFPLEHGFEQLGRHALQLFHSGLDWRTVFGRERVLDSIKSPCQFVHGYLSLLHPLVRLHGSMRRLLSIGDGLLDHRLGAVGIAGSEFRVGIFDFLMSQLKKELSAIAAF